MKVTLFPFLSVLLCMMGAMIMLLVVVAQNVREQAISPPPKTINENRVLSVQEAEEQRQKIALQAEDADWLAENYVQAEKNAEEKLADTQAKLALAEKETQKLRDELARLQQLAKQLDNQTSATPAEVEQLKQLLAQQQRRKEEAELELAQLQEEAAKQEKSYAIVPYRGANGTYRRPIYIECRDDKIIIQPEGIELVPSDFQALDRPDNPFDSVLRVMRQYYFETNQIVRGSEPYPLWIIRPSGVEMYEEARGATGNWVKEFGYEIANEDWKIQYPAPNDELRRRMAQQLEISRSRLSGYILAKQMAAREQGFGGNAQQFRVDHRGNVVPTGGQMVQGRDLQEQLAAHRQPTGREPINQGAPRERGTGQQEGKPESGEKSSPPPMTASPEQRVAAQNGAVQPPEQPVSEQMPGQPMPMDAPNQKPPQRPQDWALKDVTQFATGISRTVRIRCEANRFVLVTQAGLVSERSIPITGSSAAAADQLVQAVWEFQDSWGSAGEKVYWRPRLQVQVLLGGEQRLQELKTHLKNSGLAIE